MSECRVGPVFETIIGISDVTASLAYWAEMGYRPIAEGQLTAEQANTLYGWPSAASVVRLQNGDHDSYSLLRLIQWAERRPGLPADFTMISLGMRWSAAMANGLIDLYDSYLEGAAAGEPWKVNEMLRGWMGTEPSTPGFLRRPIVMREFVVTGPETRQVLFGRTGFTRPGYGHIYPESPRGVSPFTHHGLVLPIDDDLRWYTDVLGLENRDTHDLDYTRPGNRVHLELRPGQRLKFTRFGSGDAREGLLFTFQPYSIAPDARAVAQPGALGITLHSFQTTDLGGVRADSIAAGCVAVSDIMPNEFGEPSIGLTTPTGVRWTLVGV